MQEIYDERVGYWKAKYARS